MLLLSFLLGVESASESVLSFLLTYPIREGLWSLEGPAFPVCVPSKGHPHDWELERLRLPMQAGDGGFFLQKTPGLS